MAKVGQSQVIIDGADTQTHNGCYRVRKRAIFSGFFFLPQILPSFKHLLISSWIIIFKNRAAVKRLRRWEGRRSRSAAPPPVGGLVLKLTGASSPPSHTSVSPVFFLFFFLFRASRTPFFVSAGFAAVADGNRGSVKMCANVFGVLKR